MSPRNLNYFNTFLETVNGPAPVRTESSPDRRMAGPSTTAVRQAMLDVLDSRGPRLVGEVARQLHLSESLVSDVAKALIDEGRIDSATVRDGLLIMKRQPGRDRYSMNRQRYSR